MRDIYWDLFSTISKDHPATEIDPSATARAFIESRGLNPDLFEFSQGYVDKHQTLVIEQDGVIFQRLIDHVGKDKNRLTAYKGKVFETKGVTDSNTLWITEGILNALSLEQSGRAAIATYSSGSIPEGYFEANKDKSYVIAFDSDKAGHKGAAKLIECFKKLGIADYSVALTPHGKDWNDLIQADKLTHETMIKAVWRGRLAFSETPTDYLKTYLEQYPNTHRKIFEWNGTTYKGEVKELKGEPVLMVKRIADCTIRLIHSVIDDSEDDKQRMTHFIEVVSSREGVSRVRLDATELTRLDAFKAALQNLRQIFYGTGDDLNDLASHLFNQNPKPPKIRALSTIGFDAKSNGFYFQNFMYDKSGKRIEANKDKFFSAVGIRPFMGGGDKANITLRLEPIDLHKFISDIYGAYGNKGLMALGFYISSLFSHSVFEHYGFFPLLSLFGATHAGKSGLTKVLNSCLFENNEGQTMSASNTAKAELRKISQKSSLVCALLEGRKDKSRFDYDSILTMYNRGELYSRATTSQDNRTHSLELKAAIAFVWNKECFTLKAAKERVISLQFSEAHITDITLESFIELNNNSPEQFASVGHHLLTNRKLFESELIPNAVKLAKELKVQGVHVTRIAENHAIALAGITTLLDQLGIDKFNDGLMDYSVKVAKTKLETARNDNLIADYFFECVLDSLIKPFEDSACNRNKGAIVKDGVLIIHLPKVLEELSRLHHQFNNRAELISELQNHDSYLSMKSTRALGSVEVVKCYHFTSKTALK